MAVDSRASMGSYIGIEILSKSIKILLCDTKPKPKVIHLYHHLNNFVLFCFVCLLNTGSNSVRKVVNLSKYMLGTIAGGAADCAFWQRNLSLQCRMHELRENKRITTASASKLLANQIYGMRGRGLSMGIMIGGIDDKLGPSLYYLDDDGTRLKGNLFSVGSGGTYAYGVVDREYREDLTEDEAVELGKRAIFHATHRDAYSGGVINVFIINKDGWTQRWKGDMNEIYYGPYSAEKKAKAEAGEKAMDVSE